MTARIDRTPRYAPSHVLIMGAGKVAVSSYVAHPPGTHAASPIDNALTALECRTAYGVRWYGCERAWINSELRMVCAGFNAADYVRSRWEVEVQS